VLWQRLGFVAAPGLGIQCPVKEPGHQVCVVDRRIPTVVQVLLELSPDLLLISSALHSRAALPNILPGASQSEYPREIPRTIPSPYWRDPVVPELPL